MRKSVPTDQQSHFIHDLKEFLLKLDTPRQAGEILKVCQRVIHWLGGFVHLTEEEQKEAGIYRGLHRYD